LFQSVFDVARWPSTVFRGALAVIFTYLLPLALMTTYPALALLGKLTPATAFGALGGTLAFAAFARLSWRASIGRYPSASSGNRNAKTFRSTKRSRPHAPLSVAA